MERAVNILKGILAAALDSDADEEVIADLRHAIMVLNKNLFHQKIKNIINRLAHTLRYSVGFIVLFADTSDISE